MMNCGICSKEIGANNRVDWIMKYSNGTTVIRHVCTNCANDMENQVSFLQTFHREEPEAKDE